MPDDPPSILPRGTIIRPSRKPSPALPASAVYIQSVSGFTWSDAHAAGIASAAGGRSPASSSATRQPGSSDNRAAITAPAEPPPITTKSYVSPICSTYPTRRVLGVTTGSAPSNTSTRPPKPLSSTTTTADSLPALVARTQSGIVRIENTTWSLVHQLGESSVCRRTYFRSAVLAGHGG